MSDEKGYKEEVVELYALAKKTLGNPTSVEDKSRFVDQAIQLKMIKIQADLQSGRGAPFGPGQ